MRLNSLPEDGGRTSARRLLSAVVVTLVFARGAMAAAGPPADAARVNVQTDAGIYAVTADFEVPASAETAWAVLTDYEQIPRFMPGVTTSIVRERSATRVVIEQEAVARMLMFSRRVHLLLEVHEHGDAVRFRDAGGRSFDLYEGAWTLLPHGESTRIRYELRAKPIFDVPGLLLRRILARDARSMIDALRHEIAARRARV